MNHFAILPSCAALAIAALLAAFFATSATAQEAGWHYSPLVGEGDRAALGCTYGSTPERFACLAVRCEDDYSVGLYIHTSRAGGDSGRWVLEFDKEDERYAVTATADSSPYGARIEGDAGALLEQLKNAGLVYLDPQDGLPIDRAISLGGSLTAINRALFFCAPRNPEPVQATRKPPSTARMAPVM